MPWLGDPRRKRSLEPLWAFGWIGAELFYRAANNQRLDPMPRSFKRLDILDRSPALVAVSPNQRITAAVGQAADALAKADAEPAPSRRWIFRHLIET